jgi:hypothetical protein
MTDRLSGAIAAGAPAIHHASELQKAEIRNARTELAPRATLSPSVQRLANRPSDSALGARLDDLFRQMQGPYQVDGKTIAVPVAFRSLHGVSSKQQQDVVRAVEKEIGHERFAAIAMHVLGATSTRGTPEDVRVTTQALIDAGAAKKVIAANPGMPPERAVRVIMSAFGIGFDCRGYVLRAFLQSRGTGSLPAKAGAYFDKDAGNVVFQHESRLRRVSGDPAMARTGDIIHLKPDAEGRDHNVIVRSNELRDVPSTGSVTVAGKRVPDGLLRAGSKVRVLTVDSSWGGSGNPFLGGAERRVWLHDESTGRWGFWVADGSFHVSEKPYDHDVDGVFRPRSER